MNWATPADLYSGAALRPRGSRYKRFPSAAEAVRFAVEELPPTALRFTAIESDEEDIDVMRHASRMSMSIILTYPGRSEAWAVTAEDLDRALANDQQSDIDTGHS